MLLSVWERLYHVEQLDRNALSYHGGCTELTKVGMSPPFLHGRDFAFVQLKTRQRPLHVSDRDSTYELLGKNANQQVPPGTLVTGFHISELNSLFQTTREQAWPEQCGGGNYMDVGRGILVDFSLRWDVQPRREVWHELLLALANGSRLSQRRCGNSAAVGIRK